MAIPEWAKRLKGKKQLIKDVGGRFYLYEAKYVYSSKKKRTMTKPGKYLGRLDEDKGLIKADIRMNADDLKSISAPLEYKATALLEELGSDIRENLRECFGTEDGDAIMAIGKFGLTDKQPEKRIRNAYECSYESISHPGLALSKSSISLLSERIGKNRDAQLKFMHKYIDDSSHIIFDGTRLVCYSKGISEARIGYNHNQIWDPQVNLMYCFSLKPVKSPIYYFPFPGNSPDLSNIGYCIKEAGIKNVVLIADKGFRDDANSMLMKENGIIFLVPLKRNDSSIDYGFMGEQAGTAVPFGANVFTYHGRAICFRTIQEYEYKDVRKKRASRGRPKADEKPEYEEIRQDKIVLFLDTELKNEEESTYCQNMANGVKGYTPEGLKESSKYFGTIALAMNSDISPKEMFEMYKERELIEDGNKAYRHVLGKFASNKTNSFTYSGWLFFNHISLMLYYRILAKIKEKNLQSNCSVEDVIDVTRRITRMKVGDEWIEKTPALSDMKPYKEIFD